MSNSLCCLHKSYFFIIWSKNHVITKVHVKQPWEIRVNESYEYTETNHNKTKLYKTVCISMENIALQSLDITRSKYMTLLHTAAEVKLRPDVEFMSTPHTSPLRTS